MTFGLRPHQICNRYPALDIFADATTPKPVRPSWRASLCECHYFRSKVREAIAAKEKGQEIEIPNEEQEPEVINLMDALKRSVAHEGAKRRNGQAKPHGNRRSHNRRTPRSRARRQR
jgi:hypothetical protein